MLITYVIADVALGWNEAIKKNGFEQAKIMSKIFSIKNDPF